jgi:hypothetical protein
MCSSKGLTHEENTQAGHVPHCNPETPFEYPRWHWPRTVGVLVPKERIEMPEAYEPRSSSNRGIVNVSKPDCTFLGVAIYLSHERNLGTALVQIRLIDADLIYPENSLSGIDV